MPKFKSKSLKITTVNIPKAYLAHLHELIDKDDFKDVFGFEPSISECVRHALKDFIIKNYDLANILLGLRPNARESRRRELQEQLEEILVKVPRKKKPSLGRNFEGRIDYQSKGINERL